MEADVVYFRRRALEERTSALASKDPRVREVHLELAHRYEGAIRDTLTRRRIQRIRLLEAV